MGHLVSSSEPRAATWVGVTAVVLGLHTAMLSVAWEPAPGLSRSEPPQIPIDVEVLSLANPAPPAAEVSPPVPRKAQSGTPAPRATVEESTNAAEGSPDAAVDVKTSSADLPEQAPAAVAPPSPETPAATPTPPPTAQNSTDTLPAAQGIWHYDVSAQTRGITMNARATLRLQESDQQYAAEFEVRALLIGSRTQSSAGVIGRTALVPLTFSDKARRERHLQFDWTSLQLSDGQTTHPLAPDTQDRLSILLQLGRTLTLAAPQTGANYSWPVVSTRGQVQRWDFVYVGAEDIALPNGAVPTWKLQRQVDNESIELWYPIAQPRIPVRIRLREANGDEVDQLLRSQAPSR